MEPCASRNAVGPFLLDDGNLRFLADKSLLQPLNVDRQARDPVGLHPPQICPHQEIGHDFRLFPRNTDLRGTPAGRNFSTIQTEFFESQLVPWFSPRMEYLKSFKFPQTVSCNDTASDSPFYLHFRCITALYLSASKQFQKGDLIPFPDLFAGDFFSQNKFSVDPNLDRRIHPFRPRLQQGFFKPLPMFGNQILDQLGDRISRERIWMPPFGKKIVNDRKTDEFNFDIHKEPFTTERTEITEGDIEIHNANIKFRFYRFPR